MLSLLSLLPGRKSYYTTNATTRDSAEDILNWISVLSLVEELLSLRESVCDGRRSMKPWRTPGERKKFAVCVGGDGRKKLVRFGDPNLEIKRDNPERRSNFRARHGCGKRPATKNPKQAAYWSCRTWTKKPVSQVVKS